MTVGKSELRIAGYVLAGGGSTRFGRDKALVEFGGQSMLARMIERMQHATKQVRIVGPRDKYAEPGIEIIEDRWPGEGPLGGIITALEDAAENAEENPWNLMVSCDMPFMTEDWLKFLAVRATKSRAQVVLPHSATGPEPLCAGYRTDAASALRAAFETGVRKITDALKQVSTEVLDETDWKRFDSAGRLFWNMNTAADYEKARRLLDAGNR
jgi:molybdopterin-guanine dinucleotide biosynthesis protein A